MSEPKNAANKCGVPWNLKLAEDEGFEPSIGFPIHAFQACALGRYANPPVAHLFKREKRGEKVIGGPNYDSPQILRAALTCRTPPGLEGSKGRSALMGVRGIPIRVLVR